MLTQQPLDRGVAQDQGRVGGLLEGDDQAQHQADDHAAEREQGVGQHEVDAGESQKNRETGGRTHDHRVQRHAPLVHRCTRRCVVHLGQVGRAQATLGGLSRGAIPAACECLAPAEDGIVAAHLTP